MTSNLHKMVDDPAPLHPHTMLELIEAVMVAEGGEDHPWIPGATATPLLRKLRATIAKYQNEDRKLAFDALERERRRCI
jgi:hypothetical protein